MTMAQHPRNHHPLIDVGISKIHAQGAFARKDIPKGTRIVEYKGPKLTREASQRAMDDGNAYIFHLNDEEDIDGSVLWNIGRYVNHSCGPNLECLVVEERVWLDALRDIKKGEELTWNYGYGLESFETRQCRCGQAQCSGYMVAEDDFEKVSAFMELKKKAKMLQSQKVLPVKSPEILYIATSNTHKVAEISKMLGAATRCIPMSTFSESPVLSEEGDTFTENALAKATQFADWLLASGKVDSGDWMTLADDSGLEVDALGGAPGVHSARFAADETDAHGNASDAANNTKLLRMLKGVDAAKRVARFRCVLALVRPSPGQPSHEHWTFDGTCEGVMGDTPTGAHGFGYDPLFFPNGFDQTFASLGSAIKNTISHRSLALAKLKHFLHS